MTTSTATQCKAKTNKGTRCVSQVAPPSRSLCRRHQGMLERGQTVMNHETGRKFPAKR